MLQRLLNVFNIQKLLEQAGLERHQLGASLRNSLQCTLWRLAYADTACLRWYSLPTLPRKRLTKEQWFSMVVHHYWSDDGMVRYHHLFGSQIQGWSVKKSKKQRHWFLSFQRRHSFLVFSCLLRIGDKSVTNSQTRYFSSWMKIKKYASYNYLMWKNVVERGQRKYIWARRWIWVNEIVPSPYTE